MAETPTRLPPGPAEKDLSGRQLGDFRLLRRLGRGAMAEVYLAEQNSLKRQVAVKILKRHLAGDENYVQRFHNEAQSAAALIHANIVQIHDVGCIDGIHFIAQEYVPGQNLQELLRRRGPPDVALAVNVMRQVASALRKAAQRGIIHRDIKPENIMLARTGEVKVADFGLARLAEGGVQLTQVGMTMGTPLYMSPEQVEGRPLDPRSDLYSLGVTCYHMLAGRPPFQGDTPLNVAVQHLHAQPEPLERLRPDLPIELCRIVHKLLAKDAAARYATAGDLLHDLRAVPVRGKSLEWSDESGASAALGAATLTERQAATQRLQIVMQTALLRNRRRRRVRARWAALAIAAFVLGGALAWATRPAFLLESPAVAEIPRQTSAEEQLSLAKLSSLDTREAWLNSVERNFPRDLYYVRRSKQDLASLYLTEQRWRDAGLVLDQLASIPDEPEFRAYGLAGLAFLATWNHDHDLAVQQMGLLNPIRDKLVDANMRQLVRWTLGQTREALGTSAEREWDDWVKSLPAEQPGPDDEE